MKDAARTLLFGVRNPRALATVQRCRWKPLSDYLTAIGLTGDPTAPVNGRGHALKKKEYLLSIAHSRARSSKSKVSPIVSPMYTIPKMWKGERIASVSLGKTSTPQVSAATAEILCSHIHSSVSM